MARKPDTIQDAPFVPPAPDSVEATGLGLRFLTDLAVKLMYLEGEVLGYELAERMRLPHAGVVEELLVTLKEEKLCEVKGAGAAAGTSSLGRAIYRYELTDRGRVAAREAMERSQYAGPAPVALPDYNAAIRRQSVGQLSIHQERLERALSHLVVDRQTIAHLGAALNSLRSVFLFGPPGDGKTVISESIGRLVLEGTLYIPYAVETSSQVIRVFDALNHVIDESLAAPANAHDQRWIPIRRPVITVGGEMTLAELDLILEPTSRYYEAPVQMKANGGMLLIDDFGRQQARPRDLLNRWIVPLEKRIDFLTLHTGNRIAIPFDTLVVFATNIAPKELVDEAFLRRIRHKIEIGDPSWDEYRQIFLRICQDKGIPFSEEGLAYLIRDHYLKRDFPRRRCHPRDLIEQVIDIARYLDIPPRLSEDLIDRAIESYFVEL